MLKPHRTQAHLNLAQNVSSSSNLAPQSGHLGGVATLIRSGGILSGSTLCPNPGRAIIIFHFTSAWDSSAISCSPCLGTETAKTEGEFSSMSRFLFRISTTESQMSPPNTRAGQIHHGAFANQVFQSPVLMKEMPPSAAGVSKITTSGAMILSKTERRKRFITCGLPQTHNDRA